jgi:hypothetical protein
LEVKLHKRALQDAVSDGFYALSYVWGPPSNTAWIKVNGKYMKIRENLAICSRHLQGVPRPLWADAICVNQDDVGERNQQALLMTRIYRSARMVLSWLGAMENATCIHAAEVILAVKEKWAGTMSWGDLFSEGKDANHGEWMTEYPEFWQFDAQELGIGNKYWNAVNEILKSEYWRRVWTFQESCPSNQNYNSMRWTRALQHP